jgi:uncharacterized protein (TIGR02271 family)
MSTESTMNRRSAATVVGVFEDPDQARAAIEALKYDGFSGDAISILSPDRAAAEAIAEDTGTHAGSGAATGAVAGGVLGGLGGWLVGVGALAIPGVGPVIAAGAFAAALGGAAIGAGVGAIAGALIGMGVPEEHAKYYEGEARAGKTLVTVRANGRYDEAQRILRDHDAYDVESRTRPAVTGDPLLQSDGTRPVVTDEQTMQLRQEELLPHKEKVQTGQVQLGKHVVTEHRTLEVPVAREELTVERTPVDRRRSDRPIDEHDETISVPLREEQVELEKRPVVYEEVGVSKHEKQDTQQISDTVRREEAHIEHEGDVEIAQDRS